MDTAFGTSPFEDQAADLVGALAQRLLREQRLLVTAESCTGGMLASICTAAAGSSQWFDRGIVSYSNAAKSELLQVPAESIAAYGAVSETVVKAMAAGAIDSAPSRIAVAITGIAGPSGGSADKPVGTVWFAWANHQHTVAERLVLTGDRQAVRQGACLHALRGLLNHG